MFTFLNIQNEFCSIGEHDEVTRQLKDLLKIPLMVRILARGMYEQNRIKFAPDYPGYAEQYKRRSAAQFSNYSILYKHIF